MQYKRFRFWIFFSGVFVSFLFLSCSHSANQVKKVLKENQFYLIFTNGINKDATIIKHFNMNPNSRATHVGLLTFINNNWRVVHFLNDGNSAYKEESLKVFLESNNHSQTPQFSVWSVKNSTQFREEVNDKINRKRYRDLPYDYNFSLTNKKLYCSEFIYTLFYQIDPKILDIQPIKRPLTPPFNYLLDQDTLHYLPADIFQHSQQVSLVYRSE